MNTTHLVRVTRTLTLRGTVTLEVPINITADQIRETLTEGNELEGLLIGLPHTKGEGPHGKLGRVQLKQESEDWRAEYVPVAGPDLVEYREIRRALADDELLTPLADAQILGAAAAVEAEEGVAEKLIAEAVTENSTPAAKKTAKKTAKKKDKK